MPRPNKGASLKWIAARRCWYIIWYEQGSPRKRSTGTADSREAEAILAAHIARKQTDGRAGPRDPSAVLVTTVLTYYSENKAEHAADPVRIGYAIAALIPFFQSLSVADVTEETCRGYAKERGKKPATVRRELTTLKAAINFANGKLITRSVPVWMPTKPPGKDRWLTRHEAAKLLNAARNGRSDVRRYLPLFIVLGLYTGARKEALLSLNWTQVNFQTRRINFANGTTTNKRRAHIPIPNPLMTFLRLAYKRRSSDIGPVIHDKGRRIIDIGDSRGGSFGRACKDAGLSDVTPHVLRHTCGTWLAQKGVPLFKIGGWLGHTDERTTRLYAHHSPDYQDEALEAINRR